MEVAQHPPAASSSSSPKQGGKRPRRAMGGILKRSSSWISDNTDSCTNTSAHGRDSISQHSNHEVAQNIVNSYKRPAIIVTYEQQMETCRLMMYDLIQFSGFLVEEGHDAALAIEGYTLALTVVHLQTKIQDNRAVIRIPPEQLLTELVTHKYHTAKLLQKIHEARVKYGIYGRSLDETYVKQQSSPNHPDVQLLHVQSYADYIADTAETVTTIILYNMSLAYSLQRLNLAALQTCQLALECTRFIPNPHRALLFKVKLLQRLHHMLVGAVWDDDNMEEMMKVGRFVCANALDPTQISKELFTCEVYTLSAYPCGAEAA